MSKDLASSWWMKDARCKDEDLGLFLSSDPEDISKAKAFCSECEVRKPCVTYFWDVDTVCGGTTYFERKLLLWKRIDDETESNWQAPNRLFKQLS